MLRPQEDSEVDPTNYYRIQLKYDEGLVVEEGIGEETGGGR